MRSRNWKPSPGYNKVIQLCSLDCQFKINESVPSRSTNANILKIFAIPERLQQQIIITSVLNIRLLHSFHHVRRLLLSDQVLRHPASLRNPFGPMDNVLASWSTRGKCTSQFPISTFCSKIHLIICSLQVCTVLLQLFLVLYSREYQLLSLLSIVLLLITNYTLFNLLRDYFLIKIVGFLQANSNESSSRHAKRSRSS